MGDGSGEARAIGPGFFVRSPVGFGGFDVVGGEDLGGLEFDDGDGCFRRRWRGLVCGAWIVRMRPARRKLIAPAGCEAVVAQAVVPWAWSAGGFGFRESLVGGCGGAPVEFAVRSLVVVKVPETVELGLEVG